MVLETLWYLHDKYQLRLQYNIYHLWTASQVTLRELFLEAGGKGRVYQAVRLYKTLQHGENDKSEYQKDC